MDVELCVTGQMQAIYVFSTLLYMCSQSLLYMCPHTLAGGTYDVDMCSHNAIYVFSLYTCPHTLVGGKYDVYMCSDTAIYVSSYAVRRHVWRASYPHVSRAWGGRERAREKVWDVFTDLKCDIYSHEIRRVNFRATRVSMELRGREGGRECARARESEIERRIWTWK